ncbi:hypothetical protein Tco_1267622 [Tanacetum coccineum]
MVVQEQAEMGKGSANPIDPYHTPTIIQPSPQPQKKQKPRKTKRKDTQIPLSSGPTAHVADEAVYKRLDDSLVRAATTASNLEAEQDNGNIIKTRSKAIPNESGSQGTTLGGGPRRQETMGGRINSIDADEDITLVNDQDDADMFDVNTLAGEEVFVAEESGNVVEEVVVVIDATSIILVSAAIITDVEVTLAQAVSELKSAKPKDDKVVIQELEQGTTTTTPTTIISVPKPPQDKGKGIMIEKPMVEQVKPMKRLEQMRLDEELAFKLQAG